MSSDGAIHDLICSRCGAKLGTIDERDGDAHCGAWEVEYLSGHSCFPEFRRSDTREAVTPDEQ